jgi:hypothetical protein
MSSDSSRNSSTTQLNLSGWEFSWNTTELLLCIYTFFFSALYLHFSLNRQIPIPVCDYSNTSRTTTTNNMNNNTNNNSPIITAPMGKFFPSPHNRALPPFKRPSLRRALSLEGYVSVCICMFVCMYVCMCVMYVCMYVCMYVYVCMYMYVCMYVCCVCVYGWMDVYVYVCVYVSVCICVYVCMRICMYVCMYVCMYLNGLICNLSLVVRSIYQFQSFSTHVLLLDFSLSLTPTMCTSLLTPHIIWQPLIHTYALLLLSCLLLSCLLPSCVLPLTRRYAITGWVFIQIAVHLSCVKCHLLVNHLLILQVTRRSYWYRCITMTQHTHTLVYYSYKQEDILHLNSLLH